MSKVLGGATGDAFFQRKCKSFMSTPNYMAPEWGLAEVPTPLVILMARTHIRTGCRGAPHELRTHL